ncbi:MAG: glutamate mutase L [bacterium]
MKDKDKILRILATDCGSTTTKAILIEKVDEEYRLIVRGEAPTTVEAPYEDVTKGVLNAIKEVEELSETIVLDGENIIKRGDTSEEKGVDLYISTSSAGGGLQMMVAGVVDRMSAESAARAALGAGAIVMDVIASNDKRQDYERIKRIRTLRPDMVLLSGGTDGGTKTHVVQLAEIIEAADPKPRFGSTYNLPVIYAGNKDARDNVKESLEEQTDLYIVDNLRPTLETENLGPARDKIHDLFMEHVMAQAPGYKKLMEMTDVPIMPTPGAVGLLIETIAKRDNIEVLGVDIGGATTDVFSVFQEKFNRTVSANLGMSYSISNVVKETGLANIMRWVPFKMDEKDLRNRIRNKMIRPTTIPSTVEELQIEQAIAREALRLALEHHKAMAVSLKGVQKERTISDAFEQTGSEGSLVNMETLDIVVGSGGVLSHAPRRVQSAMMMVDAFLPEGITMLTVDSIFMMPQLGVLSTVHESAATEVFEKDCLIRLGSCVAPVGKGKEGREAINVKIGENEHSVDFGNVGRIDLKTGEKANAVIKPAKGLDLGNGNGKEVEVELEGGIAGVILDCRGRRPFNLPSDDSKRIDKLVQWYKALNLYPEK